jgi:anti-sigma factor RsiW
MTYAPRHDHPPERDLLNYARDELGEAKKARIIQHCRQCPECADRLIELTREHAPDPGPLKLSRFQKISIVLLILSLVAAVGGLMWTLQQIARQPGLPAGPEMQVPEKNASPERTSPGQEGSTGSGDAAASSRTGEDQGS